MPERIETFWHRGHRLAYEVIGEGDRTVVYMHGLLLDAELNRALASAMAEGGNRVVLFDLLGHGHSDQPRHASEYRIDSYAEQVVALLDHLGVERAVIGGVSLGANVSLVTAATHPDRVRALVLEMPVMEWAVPSAALTFVPALLAAHYGRPVLKVTSAVCSRLPRTGLGPLDSMLNAASMHPDVMSAILHGVLVGPIVPSRERREAITVPALVIAHAHDLIHPFDDARNLAAQLPACRMLQARTPFELRLRPRRLTAEVREFLEGVWASPPEPAPASSATR